MGRLRLKCDGTSAETRFRLSAKRKSPFKSAGEGGSIQSTTRSRGVRISGSNAGYTVFRGSVKSTGYPLHSTVSPPLLLPYVTVCHHVSTGPYRVFPGVKRLETGVHHPPHVTLRLRRCRSIPVLHLSAFVAGFENEFCFTHLFVQGYRFTFTADMPC